MRSKIFLTILLLFMQSSQILNSKNTSKMLTHTIRITPHQDVKQSLMDYVTQHKIEAACILTCVGSAEQVFMRYANQSNSDTLVSKFEIVSLVGTLGASSGCHLHISVSDTTGKTLGGHLQNGTHVYTTAEIVIAELTDVKFTREVDSTYGYKELRVDMK